MAEPRLALVVARAANGVIGADGRLPWRLGSDLKRFKAITLGKPVLMGRRTWDSLPAGALPGRDNLVLTRQARIKAHSAWVFSRLDVLLAAGRAMAKGRGVDEVCVIGGAELYRETLDLADRLYLTEVAAAPKGDAIFPTIDAADWCEIAREEVPAGPKDDHAFTLRTLDRRRARA